MALLPPIPPLVEGKFKTNVKEGKQGHLTPIVPPPSGGAYRETVLLKEIRDAVRGKKGKRAMAAYEKLPQATKDAFSYYLEVELGINFDRFFGRYYFDAIDDNFVTIKVRY